MPWMVCTCDRRFYAPPSMMTGAKCDECKKKPQPEPPQTAAEIADVLAKTGMG